MPQYFPARNKWRAQIQDHRNHEYGGYFDTRVEAELCEKKMHVENGSTRANRLYMYECTICSSMNYTAKEATKCCTTL